MPYKDQQKRMATARRATAAYRARHPDRVRENSKKSRDARRRLIDAIKSVPCTECGVTYPPYVMEFDHVRGEKSFVISANISQKPWDVVLAEIAKCEVVCSNCHQMRTHRQRIANGGKLGGVPRKC